MARYRLSHILFFTGLLLSFTVIPETIYSADSKEHVSPPEQSTLDKETADKTQPYYRIHQLRFNGNHHLNKDRLIKLFGWEKEKGYTRAEIIEGFERIVTAYREASFVFAEMSLNIERVSENTETSNAADMAITVMIVEGKRVRIGEFTLAGNERFSETEIRDQLGLRRGKLFTPVALEQAVERIQTLYSEYGYPTVEIAPKNFQFSAETGTVDFQLNIQEGAQVQIGEVKISGLQKTKTPVVLREILVKPNQRFDQRDIDASYRRLRNLGYFYQINPNVLEAGVTADRINFHAQVTEAKTGRLSGVIGYAPPDSEVDTAPQLTGVLEARETNLLGTGRQVNFYWKSGLLKIFRIGYAEPWIFGKPVTIGVEYGQFKQQNPNRAQLSGNSYDETETVSEEQSGNVSATTNFGRVFEGSMTLGYKRINVPNIGLPSTPTPSLDPQTRVFSNLNAITSRQLTPYSGTKYSVAFRLTRDTRDYFLNPTRGRRDSIAIEVSRSDFQLRKAWLSLQQYFPTWRKQTVAVELHGAAAWGVNIPPTELFYLGGATTLRGYDEDWFSGPRRVYLNLEYRFLVGPDSQIFGFTDLGAVTLIETPSVFDRLRVGYGIGARLESKGGILRINYGLAAGDSPLRGKIHVNLGASF
ncbi:MAG: BamA/TamA family outer membrane protein [Candidatus Poribacteria bacterium]|nr:BamA/TamA family outer membrane protein [Candidatus Poribacteria bacterium]